MDLSKYGLVGQILFRVLAVGVIVVAFWLLRKLPWVPPDKEQLREMLRQECGDTSAKGK